MTKTILFGAGASVDESVNGRVPLTGELFAVLRENKKSWKDLSLDRSQEFQESFEIATQLLLDQTFDSAIHHSGHTLKVDFSQIALFPPQKNVSCKGSFVSLSYSITDMQERSLINQFHWNNYFGS